MKPIVPPALQSGDTVMVTSSSDSLSFMPQSIRDISNQKFESLGLKITYSQYAEEVDEFDSSSIQSRVDDLHQAFADPEVRAIFAAYGGYNSNQLLRYLDWDLIQANPKIFMGFSDTTALQNAILTKTNLITYSGPSYFHLGQQFHFEYTFEHLKKMIVNQESVEVLPSTWWSDDYTWSKDQSNRTILDNTGWNPIQSGVAFGTIIGGNIGTFRLLQGTEYFPNLANSILFLEDDYETNPGNFDRDLQSLIHLPEFKGVQGIVIGRFQEKSQISSELLQKIIATKQELADIPVLANLDFGHTDPMITFPIGGQAELVVSGSDSRLTISSR